MGDRRKNGADEGLDEEEVVHEERGEIDEELREVGTSEELALDEVEALVVDEEEADVQRKSAILEVGGKRASEDLGEIVSGEVRKAGDEDVKLCHS